MVDVLSSFHEWLNGLIWGWPMIILLLGTGLYLTIITGAVQFTRLGFALKEVLGKAFQEGTGEGTVTPFQAVSAALASTVGVGNIAGVATAIALGGPGALFWLILSGVLGMCTKFVEIAVSLRFRERDTDGTMRGGAMYILSRGLGMPWLGSLFAVFTALAAFGIGNMVQANSVSEVIESSFGLSPWITGAVLSVVAALVVLGGIRRIVEVTQVLVPVMCLLYMVSGLVILVLNISSIPANVALVLSSAFTGHGAAGGFAGAVVRDTIRYGVARGLFSNEAGLGSAPIVHATAITDHPIRQATYGIFEVFVDTLLICPMTGLVILATGAWHSGLSGAALTGRAFQLALPGEWGHLLITIAIATFAFSTLIGWAFYGETAAVYLFGARVARPYRVIWVVAAFIGAVSSLQVVWSVADTLNGLMAIPNLIAILGCSALIRPMMKEFFSRRS